MARDLILPLPQPIRDTVESEMYGIADGELRRKIRDIARLAYAHGYTAGHCDGTREVHADKHAEGRGPMPDPTVPLTADDLTEKVAELIGRAYCPCKGCDGCTDWGRPTARAVLDLLASLAGTDRDGLAGRLDPRIIVFDEAPPADSAVRLVPATPAPAPPPSWRISPDGYGTPTMWDTAGDPGTWTVLTDACALPAAVWNWITAVVPPLEPEREGDPDVVTATASLRSDHA